MNSPTASDPNLPSNPAPVLQVEQVGVLYRVPKERIPSFKEYAIRWLKGQISYQKFWALQDLSLEIFPGEVFGIIGSNGAGKSTFLKVVARVLRPTQGRLRLYGEVAPLLELGAGFDFELTGRENVLLNGTILGFSRRDVLARLDRIVEFAGLQDFVDAPLRTYSTGMVARLGFAVATDVRPEILIVDEVLSVGDNEFQTRSFERIQQFQGAGTTILLVTHDMGRVQELCSRAMWLDHGRIRASGNSGAVVGQYLDHLNQAEEKRLVESIKTDDTRRWGSGKIEITQVKITNRDDRETAIFHTGETLKLHLAYKANQRIVAPIFGMAIHRQDGLHITGPNTATAGLTLPEIEGEGQVEYCIPALTVLDGLYEISVAATNHEDTEIFDYHDRIYPFRVVRGGQNKELYGMMTMQGEWHISPVSLAKK